MTFTSAVARRVYVPADQLVANTKIKNRIADGKNADQLSVVFIPYEIPKSSTISIGYRNRPGERGKPEKVRPPSVAVNSVWRRPYPGWLHIFAGSKMAKQIR
jgi:hypothetical protein